MFQWKIKNLEVVPTQDGFSNVVIAAEYVCSLEQGEHKVEHSDWVTVPKVNPNNFTNYKLLNEQQVIFWLWAECLSKSQIEQELQKKLSRVVNPPEQAKLPWD